ncbi:unnamed protein product [Coffea canephora]|uniref:Inositol polyphosphate-related phosphatase domain-containing protein n=1 Tax=Coffea canephora TaxID=49390 RepID=A0A068UL10_COFCA|nr:unnamed protein product [Coffea canephora]
MFVGTWNVGGKPAEVGVDLKDWTQAHNIPPDLYIFGFQEIVPLNAANVLVKLSNKQMVGILLCVWVRAEIYQQVTNLKVSCVGTAIMGYMGNKGSVSISMTLYHTSFCFVCTHLASGEKENDRIHDYLSCVRQISIRYSSFSAIFLMFLVGWELVIVRCCNIFWVGDLNYRLASGYDDTPELLKKHEWQWQEGQIHFAPTYKHLINSDHYKCIKKGEPSTENKARILEDCDRILWRGKGMKQIIYARAESRFSDHRPVYFIFSSEIDT